MKLQTSSIETINITQYHVTSTKLLPRNNLTLSANRWHIWHNIWLVSDFTTRRCSHRFQWGERIWRRYDVSERRPLWPVSSSRDCCAKVLFPRNLAVASTWFGVGSFFLLPWKACSCALKWLGQFFQFNVIVNGERKKTLFNFSTKWKHNTLDRSYKPEGGLT